MPERSLRVLLVDGWIAPYRLALFDRLGEEVDLTVLFCESSPNASYLRHYTEPSFDGYSFSGAVLRSVGLNSFSVGYSLVRWLATPYDVYIAKDEPRFFFNTALIFAASRLFRKPFILWSEVIETRLSRSRPVRRKRLYRIPMPTDFVVRYRRFFYDRMDGCVANSEKAREYVVSLGADPGRIVSGGQVMPAEKLPDPVELEVTLDKPDRNVILYVGYFLERKGVDVLIDAVLELDDDKHLLLLAGSGPEEESLRRRAGNTSHIRFLGYIDGGEKAYWFNRADVTVLPTRHDPWGLVVNESIHYGTPAITTDEAGAADLVRGSDCGLVVPADDVNALSNAIRSFFENETLRTRLTANARSTEQCHDLDYAIEPFIASIHRQEKLQRPSNHQNAPF